MYTGVMRIMSPETTHFWSPTNGRLTFDEVIHEVSNFISSEPTTRYRIIVGSDSQVTRYQNAPAADFVGAIILHRVGHGARYFWMREKRVRRYTLRERMYEEAALSLLLAQRMEAHVIAALHVATLEPHQRPEIHIDMGRVGETKAMIQEVVGMVRGSGFTVKIKPDSYGAKVADRYTRGNTQSILVNAI